MHNEVTTSKDDKRINWHTATFMALFHIGAVAALFMFSWQALVAAVVLWWISASLGVGMGFHRLLTHRGYKTPKLVEYFMTVCGLLALEGGAINWVVTHRIHHAHTDAPGDPHTPREGGWWAHIGWMLKGTAQSHDKQTLARYAPDMVKDRFHVLANNFYWIPIIFSPLGCSHWGVGHLSCGPCSSGSPSIFMRPGWLTRRHTCGAGAGSPRAMILNSTPRRPAPPRMLQQS